MGEPAPLIGRTDSSVRRQPLSEERYRTHALKGANPPRHEPYLRPLVRDGRDSTVRSRTKCVNEGVGNGSVSLREAPTMHGPTSMTKRGALRESKQIGLAVCDSFGPGMITSSNSPTTMVPLALWQLARVKGLSLLRSYETELREPRPVEVGSVFFLVVGRSTTRRRSWWCARAHRGRLPCRVGTGGLIRGIRTH